MDSSSRRMWERRPDETDKSYNAFLQYIKMPITDLEEPSNARGLVNLSNKLGYSSPAGKAASTIEGWSSKYNWVERARAYDLHNSQLEITVRETSLEAYQQEVIDKRTQQTALMNNLVSQEILRMLNEQKMGVSLKSTDISRLVNSIKTLDDLERRIAGLPTNFTSEAVDDTGTNETRTFIIGG